MTPTLLGRHTSGLAVLFVSAPSHSLAFHSSRPPRAPHPTPRPPFSGDPYLNPNFQPRRQRDTASARCFSALNVDAEVVQNDSDGDDDEDAWGPDRERARAARAKRPLRSAAAIGGPGGEAAVTKSDPARPSEIDGEFVETFVNKRQPEVKDEREQHIILDEYDDYASGFYSQPPISSPGSPPSPKRPGPSVYTQEEEELITSMGGRKGPRSQTQFREEGFLGDSTLLEISRDYGVPVPWLADTIASWSVPVPIDPRARLGDLVTGEQAFAVLEAVLTLDVGVLHSMYAEDDLATLCDIYDIEVKDAYELCVDRGWMLPFGVRTFLRIEQEEQLLEKLA